ncbi:hypothetical protein PCASD_24262 [Puccinia coronata f. sp. avenae]|uniref:Uncharacterized protein n=1 Tax=Puccinia coronata f. sp. avenae TaxID=200324 RepID=A0A2N5TXA3_9BASI|nr:hypothetical protein PCASD_24262 [Puccinia coronata f. sp. avenae]
MSVESKDSNSEGGRHPQRWSIAGGLERIQYTEEQDNWEKTSKRCPIKFPWGFSIPQAELSKSDRFLGYFAQVKEDNLKSILPQVGCSVFGKNQAQLIKMTVAYAQIIQNMLVPDSNLSSAAVSSHPVITQPPTGSSSNIKATF